MKRYTDSGWACEICNGEELDRTLQSNVAQCPRCGMEYYVRNEKGWLDWPDCILPPLAKEKVQAIWEKWKVPFTDITDWHLQHIGEDDEREELS